MFMSRKFCCLHKPVNLAQELKTLKQWWQIEIRVRAACLVHVKQPQVHKEVPLWIFPVSKLVSLPSIDFIIHLTPDNILQYSFLSKMLLSRFTEPTKSVEILIFTKKDT